MAVSGAISAPTYLAMRNNKFSRLKSAGMALFMTLAVGFAKEQSDEKNDPQDMQANAVGAFSGVLIPISFNF